MFFGVTLLTWQVNVPQHCSNILLNFINLEYPVHDGLPAALWPWDRLSLWEIWVPGLSSGGKGDRCVGLTTLPPSCAHCLEILEASIFGGPRGLSRPVLGELFQLWISCLLCCSLVTDSFSTATARTGKPRYSATSLNDHTSVDRNSRLHSISIRCHPRHTATNCGEQTWRLYWGLAH